MLPTNIYTLIAYSITAILIFFAVKKGWEDWVDGQVNKAKAKAQADVDKQVSKDQVEIAKYHAEVAKHNADILTASQVMEIMKATGELKQDVVQIKLTMKVENEQLTKAMEKFEVQVLSFQDSLQKFLVARVNQLEQIQTLLK